MNQAMQKKTLTLVMAVFFLTGSLFGQCPDREGLWKRLTNFKPSKQHSKEQLSELFPILDSINNCSYRNDSTHVLLLRKIADVYFQQADYIKVVQYRRQAIDIVTANFNKPSIKPKSLPGAYYWLSVAYDSLNNFTEKMKALDSCAAIAIRLKYVDRACLKALETRVEYFFDIGDYHRSIEYAMKCELLGREYADKNVGVEKIVGEQCSLNNLGWHVKALLRLKRPDEAEDILINKADEFNKTGLKNYIGMIYGQLAEVQIDKGNFEKAVSYYNLSLKYYEDDKDYFNCKQTSKDIGYNIYFKHYQDGDRAMTLYKKALRYINKDKIRSLADVFETVNIFSNIGKVYVQKSYYDSALKYFQLAFDQIKPASNEEEFLQSTVQEMLKFKKNYYLTSLVIDKGDAFRKKYEATKQAGVVAEAIRIYKTADQFLDRIKAEHTELESKLFWRSDTRRLYESAIEACYLSGNPNDAFYFFERSRAVLLNDQLNEHRWMAESDIMQQTQLKKEILSIEREMKTAGISSARFQESQSKINELNLTLNNLLDGIKQKNPLYYQSFVDSSMISISDVQRKILNNHQALVELFVGDSAVYTLVITPRNVQIRKADKPRFDSLSRIYTDYISSSEKLNRKYDEFIRVSQQLYEHIFQEIKLPAGRFIFSPDGNYFPIEALVTGVSPNPVYFINDHAVSYAYSARYLLNSFSNSGRTFRNFMGIAPVKFSYTGQVMALPGSDQSLERISGYFTRSDVLVRAKATRANFLKHYAEYKIIQLYTHAADSSSNGEPVIYFADSVLYLSDLIGDDKPVTDLIVLSACETGKGRVYKGEGVFSFNRGFAALGIPSSIVNLWSVDNESTYKLTELFYKYLAEGLTSDVALQKAKLEFIKTSESLPYFWAAPVLAGKADLIELKKPVPWNWIVAITVLIAASFWLWKKRGQKKKMNKKISNDKWMKRSVEKRV
jgi:CHAT domain-containing protein